MEYTKPVIKVIKLQCESFLAASSGGVNIDENSGTITLDPSQADTHSDQPVEGDAKITVNQNYWDEISWHH
ncbi:MAG: hypothetical protein LKE47_12355 [Prevotella sp.]|jgi:hypothetical protein|nr:MULTISPECIES: hypothetical protein [unclassified Prevotella]MCH3971125.1 hypothetical protein [Prevotella sp.]MCH4186440.1 hypothetical protein [Prevotella sp.]MCH4216553.1 hypothetical protein [Prevotella sp.]MCH4251963.1 hypothetical protein [Prevotella sp.]MCI1684809.1 hypothetical protein [Prevotella sp.]